MVRNSNKGNFRMLNRLVELCVIACYHSSNVPIHDCTTTWKVFGAYNEIHWLVNDFSSSTCNDPSPLTRHHTSSDLVPFINLYLV